MIALLPLLGLAQGAAAALAALLLSSAPVGAAVLGVGVLEALAAGRPSRGVLGALPTGGIVAAGLLIGLRCWGLTLLASDARSWGLMLAPLLGRWAVVVQCYGGVTRKADDDEATVVGRAGFTEFAWASVLALGATQALGGGVGVLLVVVAALVTVMTRILVHRRLGGFTADLLWATDALVETAVVGTLGLLAQLNT